ncbi:MAG: putative porin [Chitinophagaceae bacterium]|nr:putative porin [Chitinophagaceae bacterium]
MRILRAFILLVFITACGLSAMAQLPSRLQNMGGGMGRMGGGGRAGGGGGSDSLKFEKRDFSADSVTVIFRYLDSARFSSLDTSISDFYRRVPLRPDMISLGNVGNATRPVLFTPRTQTGWDAGFHALDPYAFNIAETRFMNTTKPFTELTYLIGTKLEQQVGILHTQNVTPDWNFVAQYRLVNAPGAYNSQNTNHANLRFNSQYTSKNKRYNAFLIVLSNGLQSAENGGIEQDSFLVNRNPAYTRDRFNIPTRMADSVFTSRNFFSVRLNTGSRYTESRFLLRQQYDFGKKDSVVTDSSVVRFFLPRLRFEHTLEQSNNRFIFQDIQAGNDSAYYKEFYRFTRVPDTLYFDDRWRMLSNDLSVIQFPDPKNPLQFLKAGATLENHAGALGAAGSPRFSALIAHGEYRNRTRNRRWDMLLAGHFHAAGRFAGDYGAEARIRTQLSKRLGSLELGFQNVNRSPSMLFQGISSFPLPKPSDVKRENTTRMSAVLDLPVIRTRLSADYHLVGNLTYFDGFNGARQSGALFNLLRLGVSKDFAFGKHWHWYLDAHLQLTTTDAPVNVPLIYTRNRLAFEGRFFKNLNLATGLDLRYLSDFKADAYSPVYGQFFLQEGLMQRRLPDISAYFNFRIRNFTAFVRADNLNTLTFTHGFGFKNPNMNAPLYPGQDLHMRLGVFWVFVN